MSTVPTCAVLTSAGTTIQQYANTLYSWLVSSPGAFTVSNAAGAPVDSWTLTHTDGWQINFRVSGGTLLVMIAPSGGIVNSASPGTPSGFVEVIGLPAPSGTNARCYVARYADALFFGWANTAITAITNAFLGGMIGSPIQGQDAAAGLNGLGILANVPNDANNTSTGFWFSTSGTPSLRQSRARVGASVWAQGLTYPFGLAINQASAVRRFTPVTLCGHPDGSGGPSATISPVLVLCKYVAWAGGGADSNAVFSLNQSAADNQAWLTINSSATNTRLRLLWNKTVDPLP